MRNLMKLHAEFNRNGVDFLSTDLDTALTMAEIALGARGDSEKRLRNTRNARRAYNAVLYFSKRVTLTSRKERELGEKLSRLQAALQELGESI